MCLYQTINPYLASLVLSSPLKCAVASSFMWDKLFVEKDMVYTYTFSRIGTWARPVVTTPEDDMDCFLVPISGKVGLLAYHVRIVLSIWQRRVHVTQYLCPRVFA